MTADEQAVLNMLLAGHTVAQAAERLGVSYHAAQHATKRAMRRVGATSRVELCRAHGIEGKVPHARRTPEGAQREIAARRLAGEKLLSLSHDFGLDVSTIQRICRRQAVREANEAAERMLRELDEPLKEVV
jgi:DNA-binding CsgD family transcriptional regulator